VRAVPDLPPVAALHLDDLTPPEDIDGVTFEAAIRVAENALVRSASEAKASA